MIFSRRAGKLNAVAVHDKRDRSSMQTRSSKAIQSLAGYPACIAAVAHHKAFGAFAGFQSSASPVATGTVTPSRPEPIGVPPGHPGNMAGHIQAAPEAFNHAVFRKKAQRRQRRVVADAGVPVLYRELTLVVVDGGEGHQQSGNQFKAASEVVDIVGLRQRDQRLDRYCGCMFFNRSKRSFGFRIERAP